MRSVVHAVVMMMCVLVGCAARQGGFDDPNREAIYDRPIEEVWPEVRQFFKDSELSFREAPPGNFVIQTEWKEEFGASKVSGYWHRYMVLGKRESPSKSKLWVIRITKSANKALANSANQLDWGISRGVGLSGAALGSGENGIAGDPTTGEPLIDATDFEERFDAPRGENSFYAESGQGARDLSMEWRVFRAIAPKLAKKENASVPVRMVAKAPEAQEAPHPLALECGLPIIGLAKQVTQGKVMLLGELHGTQEVPRFLAQAACQTAVAGLPVTVGLELPAENQARIASFITSEGTDEDWGKLMEAAFWRSPYPDGRGSEAVANLLEQLRTLRKQGLDVDVFVYDYPQLQGQDREDAMAEAVLTRVRQGPDRFFMVVSGNVHPRTRKGLPWDEDYKPMGLLLSEQVRDVVSLDVAYASGSAWICWVDDRGLSDRLDCGIRRAKGKDNGKRFFVHLWDGPNEAGYHGIFYVGRVNASAPAVYRGTGRPGADDNSGHPAPEEGRSVASVR